MNHGTPSAVSLAVLAAGPALAAQERPQLPVPPLPYDVHELMLPVADGALELAATLTRPRTEEPVPAVVLVPGGSPFDRDGTFAGHAPLLVLADALTRAGFATLRADDRGVGGSGGSKLACTLDELSADVEACFRCLREEEGIRTDQVGLLGHSGGALLAALVAAREPGVHFVVLLGCPARPLTDLIAAQLAAEGDGSLAANEAFGREAARLVAASGPEVEVAARIHERWNELLAELPAAERPLQERYVASMSRKLPGMLQVAYLRDLLCRDPRTALAGLRCPVLALWGEYDQGRKLANASAWEAARVFAESGLADFDVVQVPRVNHFLQTCATGGIEEIATIEETIAPRVLRSIVDWTSLRVGTD